MTMNMAVIIMNMSMMDNAAVDVMDTNIITDDMVPEELEIRECRPDYIGRICVIGTELKEENLKEVFAK